MFEGYDFFKEIVLPVQFRNEFEILSCSQAEADIPENAKSKLFSDGFKDEIHYCCYKFPAVVVVIIDSIFRKSKGTNSMTEKKGK